MTDRKREERAAHAQSLQRQAHNTWRDWILEILADYEAEGFSVLEATILFTSFGQGIRHYLSEEQVKTVATDMLSEFDSIVSRRDKRKHLDRLVFKHKGAYGNYHYHTLLFVRPEQDADLVIEQYQQALVKCKSRFYEMQSKARQAGQELNRNWDCHTALDEDASRAKRCDSNKAAALYAAHDLGKLEDSFDTDLSSLFNRANFR